MTIEDQIRDEKLQYDINRETAKISVLPLGKNDKYKYLTDEEILPSNQQQITEQAKFTYCPLGKAFEKQTKTTEDQEEKPINALKSLESSDKQLPSIRDFISKERLNSEIVNEIELAIEEMKELKKKKRKRLIEVKWFIKHLMKPMILEILKQYVFLVMKLEIILLI